MNPFHRTNLQSTNVGRNSARTDRSVVPNQGLNRPLMERGAVTGVFKRSSKDASLLKHSAFIAAVPQTGAQ